jgi:nucleotide-binding universal stress UspA family protein
MSWQPPKGESDDLSGTGPVVAATDFSEPSRRAVAAAARLAGLLGAALEVVHVVPAASVLQRWQAHADAELATRVESARRDLTAMVDRLEWNGPVSVRLETGHTAERLRDIVASDSERRPLLVLGGQAPGGRGVAPGTTAYRVLSLATAPVLVYKEPSA